MFKENFPPELMRLLIEKAKIETGKEMLEDKIKSGGETIDSETMIFMDKLMELFARNFMISIDESDFILTKINSVKP